MSEVKKFKERPDEFNKPAATIEIFDIPGDNELIEHGGIGLHIKFYDEEGNQITEESGKDPSTVHHVAMGIFKMAADIVSELTGNGEENPIMDILRSLDKGVDPDDKKALDEIDEKLRELGIDIESIDSGNGNN